MTLTQLAEKHNLDPVAYHKNCKDCGKFVPRKHWLIKDDSVKKRPMCRNCANCYEDPCSY